MRRLILLLMAWGLIVFTGLQVRANLTTSAPDAVAVAPGPTVTPDEITALQQALDRNPQDVEALARLGQLLYNQGDYDNAALIDQRAVAVQPHNPDLLLQLAAAQLRQAKINDARDTLVQASTLDPSRADIHLLLGLALSKSAPPDLDAAAREWQEVLRRAPSGDLATQARSLLQDLTPTPAK